MRLKKLLQSDPHCFISLIKRAAGAKFSFLEDDLQQDFWLGVLKAVERSNREEEIPFLVSSGWGEVRNSRKKTSRDSLLLTHEPICEDPDIDARLDIERFVNGLIGRRYQYFARRWLIDRVDLLVPDPMRQIAWEMGLSRARVGQMKVDVIHWFKGWTYGGRS